MGNTNWVPPEMPTKGVQKQFLLQMPTKWINKWKFTLDKLMKNSSILLISI